MKEQLLCIKADVVKNFPPIYIPRDYEKLLSKLKIIESSGMFLEERNDLLESCISKKQLVAYLLIKRGTKYFAYKRSRLDGENRLHSKIAMAGGHINETDLKRTELTVTKTEKFTFEDVIINAALREFREEVQCYTIEKGKPTSFEIGRRIVGIINSKRDLVSRVHLGIIVELEVPEHVDVVMKSSRDKQEWDASEEFRVYVAQKETEAEYIIGTSKEDRYWLDAYIIPDDLEVWTELVLTKLKEKEVLDI